MNFFTLDSLKATAEIGGWIVAGIFAILAGVGMGTAGRRKESDGLADTLINRLKETVDQQEKTIGTLSTKLDQTTKDLHQMQGRNTVLEQLFNGNETSIISFLKQAPAILEVANDNRRMSHENNAAITKLTETFERFVNTLQPILVHIENSQKAE